MNELEEMVRFLEQAEIQKRKLQELISDGFSLEQINEALLLGYLQKGETEDTFIVVNVASLKQRRKALRNFYASLFARNYFEASQQMKIYFENTPSEECELCHYFTMLLLKGLLPTEYDFSFLENISIFTSRKDPKYQEHSKLYDAILYGDFYSASKYLSELEVKERENGTKPSVFTQTFRVILDDVLLSENRTLQSISIDEKDERYQAQYKKLLNSLERMNAMDTFTALKGMAFYDRKENKPVYLKAQNLLAEVLAFIENDKLLFNDKNQVNYLSDHPKNQFDKALMNRDYQNAYIFVKKCLSINPDDPWLSFYDRWLRKLMQLNKKNSRLQEEKKHLKKLSSSELSSFVSCRDYPQLLEFFRNGKASKDQSRMHNLVYSMLEYLDKFYHNKPIPWENHVYVNEESRPLARFFEAINCNDYLEADRLFPECMNLISEKGWNPQEFSTYGYILEDIAVEKCKRRVFDLLTKSLSMKNEDFSISWLQSLQTLFETKLSYSSVLQEAEYDFYVANVLDLLLLVKENQLESCLWQYEYEEEDSLSMWKKAMNVGDYLSALSFMERKDFKKQMEQSLYEKYFVFLKRLLKDLKRTMLKNDSFVLTKKPLEEIYRMVENDDFVGAYTYYKDTSMGDISLELETTLCALLPVLNQIQQKKARALLTQYRIALASSDTEKAEQCILEYKTLIQNTVLDRNVDYYQAVIRSNSLERTSSDYQEKEELYKKALKLFQEKRNQEAIVLLDEYIERDANMSEKGYFLRGRAYEYLRQYEKATKDYLTALSIVPDPAIYYRLGQIYYYQKQYPLAFSCFLSSDERSPITCERDLIKMIELSDTLKKPGYKQLYEQKIKKLGTITDN